MNRTRRDDLADGRHRQSRPARELAAIPPAMHVEQRIRIADVAALTGYGRTRIYDLMKKGHFPQPERSGTRCSRWRLGDVLGYMERLRASK